MPDSTYLSQQRRQIIKMLRMQKLANDSVKLGPGMNWLHSSVFGVPTEKGPAPDWMSATFDELREAWESGIRFEWWKATPPIDRANVQVELVDAFHFLLSQAMVDAAVSLNLFEGNGQKDFDNELSEAHWESVFLTASNSVMDGIHHQNTVPFPTEKGALANLMGLVASGISPLYETPRADGQVFAAFFKASLSFGLDFRLLGVMYLAKNCLNRFRQQNGYRDGTYIKKWTINGVTGEDNKFLMEWVSSSGRELPEEDIFGWLSYTYSVVQAGVQSL